MIYKVGSMFAGVGGICLGFKYSSTEDSKYELSWANEIDDYACATYANNFDHLLVPGDIEKIVKPEREEDPNLREVYKMKQAQILSQEIDVLTGGFPCQAFSIAGYRKGFDDHRGNLFWSVIDLIELLKETSHKPRVLFLENVKNLLTHDKGNTYRVIKSELERLGYIVKEKVLNTKDFSHLPQNRERIYIVGFLEKEVADAFTMFDDDKINDYKVIISDEERKNNIRKMLDLEGSIEKLKDYYYTKHRYPRYFLTEEEFESDGNNALKHRINLDEEITEMLEFYQLRRGMYVRKNKNGVCPTLTANMGTGGHNVPLIKVYDGIRKLTPYETFKLHGFPIGEGYELPTIYNGRPYTKSHLYKQSGNAVSVDVITLIATEILKALEKSDK